MSDLLKYKSLLSKEYADKLSSFEKSFKDQDVDSLDTFSIILELSEALKIDIPEQEYSKIHSLADFDQAFNKIKKLI